MVTGLNDVWAQKSQKIVAIDKVLSIRQPID